MVDQRGTLTAAENRVLQVLREAPADLGPHTETTEVHALPRVYDSPLDAATVIGADRATRSVRLVDAKVARRLAARGWVTIDAGGTCRLAPEAELP